MAELPNPFNSGEHFALSPDDAAASPTPQSSGAAADFESRFVLDEEAFLNDIEPLPAFLSAPSQSYMRATELMPVLRVLAGR